MTRGPVSRPRSLCRRVLACLLLVLATLISPLESGLLPGRLEHLATESEARAQSLLVSPGEPGDCPEGWDAQDDLCRVVAPPCPSSPFNGMRVDDPNTELEEDSQLMDLSTDYPEFCEETVYNIDGDPDIVYEPDIFAVCADAGSDNPDPDSPLNGFAVVIDEDERPGECRVLQVRTCEVGSRVGPTTCRATIRRPWRCVGENQIPLNRYPDCLTLPTGSPEHDQVCAGFEGGFVVMSCEEYVGIDFTMDLVCQSYGASDPWVMKDLTGSTNRYWCEFDRSFLRAACHDAQPPQDECQDSPARCLKRASGTGGCAGTAQAMLCRSLQADYRDAAGSDPDPRALAPIADQARLQGCEPCQVLPFEPVADHCPEDRSSEPSYTTHLLRGITALQHQVMEHEHDIPDGIDRCAYMSSYEPRELTTECVGAGISCESPPAGSAAWVSTHSSGVAVVNSSVIVQMKDVPVDYRPRFHPAFDVFDDDLNEDRNWYGLVLGSVALYPAVPDRLMSTTQPIDPDRPRDRVYRLGNLSAKCTVTGLPAFRLVIQELWPDKSDDRASIEELFGAHSLQWWGAITDDKKRSRTMARGLPYWPDLTSEEQRSDRDERLLTKIDCNVERLVDPWCRWAPERSGYFRLKVARAWTMQARGTRKWRRDSRENLSTIRTEVQNLSEAQRARAKNNLKLLGCGRPINQDCNVFTPASLGLNDDLTDLLPTGPNGGVLEEDSDYLYRLSGDSHVFGGLDIRVRHEDPLERRPASNVKYSETQEFGIQVHEVRVHTVTPSR